MANKHKHNSSNTRAYLTLQHGPPQQQQQRPLGTLRLELYDDAVPRTVRNFVALLERGGGDAGSAGGGGGGEARGYRGSTFHRIIPGFMAQGGDFVNGDGTGSDSIYDGEAFDDENFVHRHNQRGVLSMANSGPHTNGCQFFCTFGAVPHLDGKHVVFGRVDIGNDPESARTLDALERVRTVSGDRPREAVTIVDCGVIVAGEDEPVTAAAAVETPVEDEDEIELDEEEEEEEIVPKTKAEAMKLRLRKLKQKMNQARQLNKQAVKEEGERLTNSGRARRQQTAMAKQIQEDTWRAANAKALQTAKSSSVDAKALTEQASDSVRAARNKAERSELQKHHTRDYHNPEGQYRNYERNLKSLPRQHDHEAAASGTIFNPLEHGIDGVDPARQADGARRIASELHRRIDQKKASDRKRLAKEIAGESESAVAGSHINLRNQQFNKQANRHYDQATAEIRQNLERGTAL